MTICDYGYLNEWFLGKGKGKKDSRYMQWWVQGHWNMRKHREFQAVKCDRRIRFKASSGRQGITLNNNEWGPEMFCLSNLEIYIYLVVIKEITCFIVVKWLRFEFEITLKV